MNQIDSAAPGDASLVQFAVPADSSPSHAFILLHIDQFADMTKDLGDQAPPAYAELMFTFVSELANALGWMMSASATEPMEALADFTGMVADSIAAHIAHNAPAGGAVTH